MRFIGAIALMLGLGTATAGDISKADALFAKRDDRSSLEAAIAAYEAAGAWTQVARGCLERIELFDDLKDKDGEPTKAADAWIRRGLKAGEKALGTGEPWDKLERI